MTAIALVGTGALASLFGARLSDAGCEVILLGTWREGLESLRQDGVCLVEGTQEHVYPVQAVSDPADIQGVNLALVLVKSWQTKRAAAQLAEFLPRAGLAVTLQNGLGNKAALCRQLGDERVAQGVTTTGATLLGPGRVRPGGEGVISLEAHPRLGPMAELLQSAGFKVQISPDLDGLVWKKLIINVAINPLTALLEVPNGNLLESPSACRIMSRASQEVWDLADALGIEVGTMDPTTAPAQVARKTASNLSSMYQDIQRGAPTEINAICGEVVRLGGECGIPTPTNECLSLAVKAKVELAG